MFRNLSILLFLLISACSPNSKNEIRENEPIVISIDNSETFLEEDFFNLFQLETVFELNSPEGFYAAEVTKAVIKKNKIFVLDDKLEQLLQFTTNGEFINSLVDKGEGPTEMPSISDFAFDHEKEEVYVISPGNFHIKVFKPDGTFVRNFKMETQADHIALLGDKPVLTLTYFNPYYKYLSILEYNGDTLKTAFPFPKETFPIGLQYISGNLTKSNTGGVLVNEPASSVVYNLDADMNLKPKYKFAASSDFWPEEDRHELNAYFEKLSTGELSFLSKYYEESESYFFFNLNAKKKGERLYVVDPRIGYYNIETGKSYLSKSEKFLMDLKGPIATDGDSFYTYISKLKLAELVNSDEKWKVILADFPEINISERADYDTPVLLKFGVK
ncbi:6-bladed beta-propeller [Algoriphagus halophytocola]|uniref:6-bladed beta-propeller n=1 Tax=Algoriphagus halophytocola TaxID=2991499 RepID=UPI0022DE4C5A|nr:6-bladed beta-propeller [Algoriphagus sp. TR-M9]WBL43832.1 6-bladed beta-propeller [Algoriphagus sp. TR-M9]